MPDIRAFRGYRYEMAKVGALSNVVAPPYDVIDDELQRRLYDASAYNVVRLELNRDEPGDDAERNKYGRAAAFLREWRREGVIVEESHPALYVYHQVFTTESGSFVRRGFTARVRLEPFGAGKIFPHEQTLSGPKADRLALYHATRFNLSPIFGLYPDASGEVLAAVEAGIVDKTPIEAIDHLGVIHRLWPVYDSRAHSIAQGLIASKPVFIADGHHRYETGLKYRDEIASRGELKGPDDPANFCMMVLVGMSDPGLLILPTHRLISGYNGLTSSELAKRLEPEFEIENRGAGESGCRDAWEAIELGGDQDVLGFGTVADDRWITARLRSDKTMDELVPEHSAEWRSLGVSVLRELVVGKLLAGLGEPSFRYVHQTSEVLEACGSKRIDLACLVPPATMEHVESIASNLETMPPKSTYFYPKLLTGLVFNPIG
jgi:uncharacterized protein (DUF1015 family)